MAAYLSSGVSVSGDYAHFVVLKTNGLKTDLIYLEEYKRTETDTNDVWFLKLITMRNESVVEKPRHLSVALDKKMLFIHSFPMDSSLSQVEQNEHLNWELSQLISSYHSMDYISDTHKLQTHAKEKHNEVLSVTIKRSLINQIHDYAAQNNLHLNIIDAAHFAAGETLLQNYPEIKTQTCTLVGISQFQIEYSCYNNGHLIEYNHRPETNVELILQNLKQLISDTIFNSVYIYGTGVDSELFNTLRTEITPQVYLINPFHRINIESSVKIFDRFANNTHRFVPAVGIALRKS
jgi:hypothetical protein